MRLTERFTRWLRRDDDAKEWFLSLVGGSWLDDDAALESLNGEHLAEGAAPVTEATVRTWTRDDPEFAEALKVARRTRTLERAREPDSPQSPTRSPYTTVTDPYAVDPAHAYGSPGEL